MKKQGKGKGKEKGKYITLLHGAGGEAQGFILSKILKLFTRTDVGGIGLSELDDGASIPLDGKHLVLTTDSHIIKPIFFPGGDIGRLAVCGTVNDLAVMGAFPIALTCSLIIEEGFLIKDLEAIIRSMNRASEEAKTPIITGDTKVMAHGELDGIAINTAGIGLTKSVITDSGLKVGNKIIITASVGNHGMALLAARLEFETDLKSDVAPLNSLIENALKVSGITAMKDPTRGGLANALGEMARKSGVGIIIKEEQIPIKDEVKGLSEVLGINPLEVANEGVAVIGVEASAAADVLNTLKKHPLGKDACIIGEVTDEYSGKVIMETEVGGRRFLEPPLGDPVPRIC